MTIKDWQFYWPAWWHLKPTYQRIPVKDYGYSWNEYIITFGALQVWLIGKPTKEPWGR